MNTTLSCRSLSENYNDTSKAHKLLSIINEFYHNDSLSHDLKSLMKKINISYEVLARYFLQYNMDIMSIDNDIYNSIENRLILYLHNQIPGSWHQQRQNAVYKLITSTDAQSIADIGFGTPSKYIKECLCANTYKITLCDLYDVAFDFARYVLKIWDDQWQNSINFHRTDMNEFKYIGQYDLFLFQDSIEHVQNPTEYLKLYVENSRKGTYFLFSLPIAPIIPAHYIAWETIKDAILWLKHCGLTVLNYQQANLNPNVDLFADKLDFNMKNLIVLCNK